ncbi:MAG TPA: hypothetical protein VGE76_20400 [Opitutaceae bacterium]
MSLLTTKHTNYTSAPEKPVTASHLFVCFVYFVVTFPIFIFN